MLIEQRENMMIKILIQRSRLPGTVAKKTISVTGNYRRTLRMIRKRMNRNKILGMMRNESSLSKQGTNLHYNSLQKRNEKE